ncbi:MAG: Ppx/GppA family phosphatase [Sandaracinaceae bacterium]|nr:Ppx/GppA family phosphatase [Sandaracinaceae bacterium]
MTRSSDRVAAIDVGSNTVLCLVLERADDGSLRRVVDRATITGLGRGSFGRGQLDDEAIARTIAAVRAHADEARALGARVVRGVGTSALRDASDRERFVSLAAAVLDRFEVISGDEEARLTFEGAAAGLALGAGEHAVLDIGGGSTEIAIGERHARWRTSLQLGSVRLYERWLASDPPTPSQIAALIDAIERALDARGVEALPPIVALAGTATTVACVARGIPWPEIERVHGLVLRPDEIEAVAADLAGRTSDARRTDPTIEPARADVLVAGAILFARVVRRMREGAVTISDGGLRWALADALLG